MAKKDRLDIPLAELKEEWEKYFDIHQVKQDKKGSETYLWQVYTIGKTKESIQLVSTHMTYTLAVSYARAYVRIMEETLIQ